MPPKGKTAASQSKKGRKQKKEAAPLLDYEEEEAAEHEADGAREAAEEEQEAAADPDEQERAAGGLRGKVAKLGPDTRWDGASISHQKNSYMPLGWLRCRSTGTGATYPGLPTTSTAVEIKPPLHESCTGAHGLGFDQLPPAPPPAPHGRQ